MHVQLHLLLLHNERILFSPAEQLLHHSSAHIRHNEGIKYVANALASCVVPYPDPEGWEDCTVVGVMVNLIVRIGTSSSNGAALGINYH